MIADENMVFSLLFPGSATCFTKNPLYVAMLNMLLFPLHPSLPYSAPDASYSYVPAVTCAVTYLCRFTSEIRGGAGRKNVLNSE